MRGFFTALKQGSSGFASLSYEVVAYQPAPVTRLEVLVGKEEVPALATIVSKERLDTRARETVEKLKELLPQQVVSVRIQARADGRIIAAETLRASRKDVTAGLYGGDYSRKKKQLKAQREGKKRLKDQVSVRIPSDVYIKMMRDG
jgi:GTP-binding protein LepA